MTEKRQDKETDKMLPGSCDRDIHLLVLSISTATVRFTGSCTSENEVLIIYSFISKKQGTLFIFFKQWKVCFLYISSAELCHTCGLHQWWRKLSLYSARKQLQDECCQWKEAVFLLGRRIHKLTEQLSLERTLRVHLLQSPSLDQNITLFQTQTILLSKIVLSLGHLSILAKLYPDLGFLKWIYIIHGLLVIYCAEFLTPH